MDTVNEVKTLVPQFDDLMREYLAWRICGYTQAESLLHAKVPTLILEAWLHIPDFAHCNGKGLVELRKSAEVLVFEARQSRLTMAKLEVDEQVMSEAIDGIETMGPRSYEYMKQIASQYDPKVRKVLGVDQGDKLPQSFDEVVIRIRRHNGKAPETAQERIIEAEYKESPDFQDRE